MGLKSDSSVVAVGDTYDVVNLINGRQDIIAISNNGYLCLKSDGTVIGIGTLESTKNWRDIVAVAGNSIGLKSDGTVLSIDKNEKGECDTSKWRDIVAIAAGNGRKFGVKSDGTVVAIGKSEYGECNIENWKDIVAIAVGYNHTVGLKSDGTVVAVGKNEHGECKTENWRDIIAIAAGYGFTLGLKIDCTVVVIGWVSNYKSDDYIKKIENWRDIVAIAAGFEHAVGLKKDGTVVVVGDHLKGEYEIGRWRDIGPVPEELIVKSRLKLEERRRWIQEGLCHYCGGEIGGLFTKKCKSCGREHFED